MALFGRKKAKTTSLKRFRPIVVHTQNVAKELLSIARSHEMKVDDLDFTILDTQSYTRMAKEGEEIEWEEISVDAIYDLDEATAILNPLFQLKQEYEIEIFGKTKEDQYNDFHIAIGANATKCKIYLSIKAGSKVSYTPTFEQDLWMMINKSKVRAGILINIFDEMLHDTVSKITAKVRVAEDMVFNENETYLVADGYEPTLTQDDQLINHYDKNHEASENEKVDYSKRGFIQSVHEDELLMEYIKEVPGQPGRNCRGEFMNPKEAQVTNAPTFTVDETIKQVETEKGVEYRAVENGYISIEGGVYSIKTDMEVGEVSFKTTGSISTGLDTDVTLNVKETDAQKDAIGMGMEVDASNIEVEGNVGSNSVVNAIKATIGGQTHKTATLRANELDINVHKGMAYGKNIKINRLEHGIVDGDNVTITQALGGDIRAKEIKIELCGSYVRATASKLIEIEALHSGENVFTIDPLLKKNSQEGSDETLSEIEDIENDIKEINKEIAKYTEVIKGNQATFNTIKKRLIHYKKNGVKMPESFVKQFNKFVKIEKHLAEIKIECDVKRDRIKLLSADMVSLQDDILEARIINKGVWIGHNEIKFKLVEPPVELVYKPVEGSTESVFGLEEVEEGQFQIKVFD